MADSAYLCLSKRFYGVCLRDWHHVQSHSINYRAFGKFVSIMLDY